MTAGIATLEQLKMPGFYDELEKKSDRLARGLAEASTNADIPVFLDRVGSMMGMFFTAQPVSNFEDAKTCDLDMFSAYYRGMLEKGIYLAPSQFEAGFVSSAHADEHIDETINAAGEVLSELKK